MPLPQFSHATTMLLDKNIDAAHIQRYGLSRTLPGLSRFHMVGQWADAALGVSVAAMNARTQMKSICKEEGKSFTTKI